SAFARSHDQAEKVARLEKIAADGLKNNASMRDIEVALMREERTVGAMVTRPTGRSANVDAELLAVALAMGAGGLDERAAAATVPADVREAVMNQAATRELRAFGLHALVRATLAAHGRHVPTGRVTEAHVRECFALAR